jgi:hypothetical protein
MILRLNKRATCGHIRWPVGGYFKQRDPAFQCRATQIHSLYNAFTNGRLFIFESCLTVQLQNALIVSLMLLSLNFEGSSTCCLPLLFFILGSCSP